MPACILPMRTRALRGALILVLFAGCSPRPSDARASARPVPPVEAPRLPEQEAPVLPVAMDAEWRGFGVANRSYLAPTENFVRQDGFFDVVVHFHAGQMSDRDFRESGVRGVFVSCGYGIGTDGYAKAFESPDRFGTMMRQLSATLGRALQRADVRLGRLALASWSAGFAAISRILSVAAWYERTDAVVLLDSLHAQYIDKESHKRAPRGADDVDVRGLRHFIRFARDARMGQKLMILTYSAIVPPDYASTAESTAALLREADVSMTPFTKENRAPTLALAEVTRSRTMSASVLADERDLHVRGYGGTGPQDHFDHLHLIGHALKAWLVPRWGRD